MNEENLAKRFEDATYHCEHHNPDLNFVGKFALSEVPRINGYKVVLTGEGADEQFAGYPVYLPDFLNERDYAWSQNVLSDEDRQRLYAEAEAPIVQLYNLLGSDSKNKPPSLASSRLNNITTPASMAGFQPSTSIFAPWTARYWSTSLLDVITDNVESSVQELIQTTWHPLHSALYVWTKGHLANNLLSCLGDRTEMAHSIEARPPFLDHKLTEYINGLPPSVKLRWDATSEKFVEKWILREVARPFVTDEIYKRKKHPYIAPTTFPTSGPLHRLFQRLVTRENVEALGFVNWDAVKRSVDQAFIEKDVAALRLVMVLAEWVVISKRFGVAQARN